jgi:hypothetical protein
MYQAADPCIYIYFAKVLYVTAFGFVGLVFHGEIEEDEEAQPANARIFTSKVGYGMMWYVSNRNNLHGHLVWVGILGWI